jgi:DNA-3-methyladenine glycosylase I
MPESEPAARGVILGVDGLARCPWAAGDPVNRHYHDTEWGLPVHGERALYERVTLEAFQAGLSWRTILNKRPAFRAAFAGFDPDLVARFGDADVERLMDDPGIVRNRAKIEAARTNARATIALRYDGGLDRVIWSAPPRRHARAAHRRRGPHRDRGVQGAGRRPARPRVRVRGTHYQPRADGGRRPRRCPSRRLSSPRRS